MANKNSSGTITGYTVYHHITDHLGSVRAITDASTGTVVETSDYLPFGTRWSRTGGSLITTLTDSTNRWRYSGKEEQAAALDPDLTLIDYGARMYDPTIVRWMSVDPLAEKYRRISPYAYCNDNPNNYSDFQGDSLTIVHRTGFLGLGRKETLTYNSGILYKADGSSYSGKINGFLKSVMKAITSLKATAEGASLVSELQNSSNMFTIKRGNNAFIPNSLAAAAANLSEIQPTNGERTDFSGSGGTIYWNPYSTRGGLDVKGSTTRPAYIGLGHEMGHASDSNQGVLHYSSDYTNPLTGSKYSSTHQGLLKSEWRAVYRENLIREQAKIPLRAYYGSDITTGVPRPIGPRLLNSSNKPINYP